MSAHSRTECPCCRWRSLVFSIRGNLWATGRRGPSPLALSGRVSSGYQRKAMAGMAVNKPVYCRVVRLETQSYSMPSAPEINNTSSKKSTPPREINTASKQKLAYKAASEGPYSTLRPVATPAPPGESAGLQGTSESASLWGHQ